MNLRVIILIITVSLGLVSCNQKNKEPSDRGYHAKIGDNVENILFNLTDGNSVTLDELRGKVVVLQFTASWCSVCRKEMPHLEKEVWQRFKNDDFILIGVDYDESLEKVIEFKNQMEVTYPIALDPKGEIFHKFAYKGAGVTRNIVIDKEGRIAFLTRLFDRKEFDSMKFEISKLIND